jgi:isoquinoline 1-oxidoreductase beta subunit
MESMIDELAWAAGRDPVEFRLELLKGTSPRHARALQLAAGKAGWGTPPPDGRARGVAVHESFGSIIAEVAEVSVDAEEPASPATGGARSAEHPTAKSIRVHKVTCAVDCGQTINPLGIEAQVQGAVAYGLSAVLYSAVTLKDGRVEQSNFHDYRVLRMPDMPKVEVHILESDAKMGGIGEPATAPVSAAVANAVYALTKQRLRSLPLRLA